MKISWGTGILITVILFIAFTVSSTLFFMGKDVDLVTENYYEKELRYQEQLDQMNRAIEAGNTEVTFENGMVAVTLPGISAADKVNGSIHFYRPSNSKNDFSVNLNPDSSGRQYVDAAEMIKGYWKVKIQWDKSGQSYYSEKQIILL